MKPRITKKKNSKKLPTTAPLPHVDLKPSSRKTDSTPKKLPLQQIVKESGGTPKKKTPTPSTTLNPRVPAPVLQKRKETDAGPTAKPRPEQVAPKRPRSGSAPQPMVIPRRPRPALGPNAKSNRAFNDWITRQPKHVITEQNYLTEISKSVRENRPASYVVNIILPYTNIADISKVVDAIMAGTEGMDGRVAFVFGLNAKKDKAEALDTAWQRAATAVADNRRPIAVLKDTFGTAKFPYGKMRNAVLGSKATKEIVASFFGDGTRPYVSIQDFDKAKRTVPSGEHVFNHFSAKLAGEDPLNPDESFPIQPLMMVGGYRPGDTSKLPTTSGHAMTKAELDSYVREDMLTRENLAKIHPLLPYGPEPNLYIDGTMLLTGDERLVFGDGGAEFGELSRGLNLRYTDELTVLAKHPIIGVDPPADEVDMGETSTTTTVSDQPEQEPVGWGEEFLQPEEEPEYLMDLDQLERRTFVQSKAENLQHDIRGIPFVTDFMGGSIETDLTRIASSLGQKWARSEGGYLKHNLAQSHVPPKAASDRIVGIKAHLKGTKLADYGQGRDSSSDPTDVRILEESEGFVNWVEPEPVEWETTELRTLKPMRVTDRLRPTPPGTEQIWAPTGKTRREQLGATQWEGTKTPTGALTKAGEPKFTGSGVLGKPYDRLGETVSAELRAGPYARIYTGIQPSQFAISMHSVALSSPGLDTLRKLEQLKRNVLPQKVTDLDGDPVPGGLWVAPFSLYDAVTRSLGRVDDAALRSGVIDTAIAQLTAEGSHKSLGRQPITTFLVDHPMSDSDLAISLTQDNGWITPKPPTDEPETGRRNPGFFLPGDTERAHNAQELTMRLVATHLGRTLRIYRTGQKDPIDFKPFTPAKAGPIALNEKLTIDKTGLERPTFTPRG